MEEQEDRKSEVWNNHCFYLLKNNLSLQPSVLTPQRKERRKNVHVDLEKKSKEERGENRSLQPSVPMPHTKSDVWNVCTFLPKIYLSYFPR